MNKIEKVFASYNFVLASKSPRRQELLRDLGINFTVEVREVEEIFPDGLSSVEIAKYLAELKVGGFEDSELQPKKIIITADTIVVCNGKVLGKPADREEAIEMLKMLSDNEHEVITGVCLKSSEKSKVFSTSTKVFFKKICQKEIEYYVDTFKPFDKAGAYGIQEWIGFVAITKIEGSYFNVVGLPLHDLYENILNWEKEC
ncbi:MAG: Maf family nucleotide pyrophosphatase [Bacteroidota bacterium]|nr:Maf family nucleotide pyrophosphatase [Bacteroidota bacterium]